jgi:hypothetical protein
LPTRGRIGKGLAMKMWHALLLASLSVQSAMGWAGTRSSLPAPESRQLRGLGVDEANSLLAKLVEAQHALKAGKFQTFELLAGSAASYPMAKVSPRDAFLQVRFDKVWEIARGSRDNPLWQPYKLAYAPNGLGQLYWDIEVVLGVNGNIERVLMVYKPPAPF